MNQEVRKKLVRIIKELTVEERKDLFTLLKEGSEPHSGYGTIGTVNRYSDDYVGANDIDNIAKIQEDSI